MNRRVVPTILALALGLAGCGAASVADTNPSTSAVASQTSAAANPTTTSSAENLELPDFLADNKSSHADADDGEYDLAESTEITLGGQDVTITQPGTYLLSGSLTDASVIVDSAAEGKVRLVLAGVTMTSSVRPPILINAADEVVIIAAEGTINTVIDNSSAAAATDPDAPNAAIFSMADLTIAGTGQLEVTSASQDGIASKDGLVVLAGTLSVQAGDDGLRGKDYLIIEGGNVSVSAAQDALKATNEDDDTIGYVYLNAGQITLTAGDDAVHAEGDLLVAGGTLDVASSHEGLEGANIAIAGGSITLNSTDDGLNATSGTATGGMGGGPGGETSDGSLLAITGGDLLLDTGGDGIDSNGDAMMSGGTVLIHGPTGDGNGAIDVAGDFAVSGGTLIAAGSSGMAETPAADSSQGWVAISQQLTSGQTLAITDGATVLASFTASKPAASIVISAPGISSGTNFAYTVNGQAAGSITAGQTPDRGMGGRGGGRP